MECFLFDYLAGKGALAAMADLTAKGEIQRHKSVEIAIADSRIERLPPPEQWELDILSAYIRGEIEPQDLVEAIKTGLKDSAQIIERSTAPRFGSPP